MFKGKSGLLQLLFFIVLDVISIGDNVVLTKIKAEVLGHGDTVTTKTSGPTGCKQANRLPKPLFLEVKLKAGT